MKHEVGGQVCTIKWSLLKVGQVPVATTCLIGKIKMYTDGSH